MGSLLRAACHDHLPPYAQPSLYLVEQLPLLPNGKLDRQRLLALAARSPVPGEEPITAAWRAVLPRAPLEEELDFFQAGGTSRLVVELLGRLNAAGVTVSLERFYAEPTLGALRRGERTAAAPAVCMLRPLGPGQDELLAASMNLLADEARARGYRGLATVNSHALTHQICEELGYRTEARLDARTFVHAGARPFAHVPEDGAELCLDILRFHG